MKNDLELSEMVSRINRNAATLNRLLRDQMESELFRTLSDIELAAKFAQNRMNELRFKRQTPPLDARGFVHEMGTLGKSTP